MDVGWLDEARGEYASMAARGDRAAALACVATVLERLYRDAGPQALADPWIDALDAQLERGYAELDAATESRLLAGGLAVLGRRPSHPVLPVWALRAMAQLRGDGRADDAIRAARFAFEYALRSGNFRTVGDVIAHAKHRLDAGGVSPAIRVAWLESMALYAWLCAEHADAYRLVDEGLAVAERELKPRDAYGLHEQGASAALSAGDLARADRHFDGMRRTLEAGRAQDVGHGHFLAGARALLGGDERLAAERIAACRAIGPEKVPAYFATLWRLGSAHVRVARGEWRPAERDLAEVIARAGGLYWRFLEFSALIDRAWLRIRQGRPDAATADLARALATGAAAGYRNCDPWWNPVTMAEVAALARERDLQPEYVALLVGGHVAQ